MTMQRGQAGGLHKLGLLIRKVPVVGSIVWWMYMIAAAPGKIFVLSEENERLKASNQEVKKEQADLKRKLEQANQALTVSIKEMDDEVKEFERSTGEQQKNYEAQLASLSDIITKECVELGKLKVRIPDLQPVFIHSIFRSGSTYLWNKFRSTGKFWAYHEPFHEVLLALEIRDQKKIFGTPLEEHTKFLGHPPTDKHYFWEYFTINSKVPAFQKEFTLDFFCINPDEGKEDLKDYLYFLIGYSPLRPVFKFTRSSMRSGWMKKHFDAVNIYLLRHPRFQFESYQSHLNKGNPYFHTMTLMTIGKNQDKNSLFAELSSRYNIPRNDSVNFKDEMAWYTNEVLPHLKTKELYVLFYGIWLCSLIENLRIHAIFFNIDAVDASPEEKQRMTAELKHYNIDLDLSDCSIARSANLSLHNHEFDEAEQEVHRTIRRLNLYDKGLVDQAEEYMKNKVFDARLGV